MKKYQPIVVGVIVIMALAFYFSKSGLWKKTGTNPGAPAIAQAQGKSDSMPGMPDMKAEKPAATAEAAEQATTEVPTVEIPKDKQQLIGLKTATVSVEALTKDIRTVGLVEYDQRKLNTINTKLEGWVEKLYINFTGTYVRKGDPIADIYSPELWATQQEFINMVRWAKGAKTRGEGRTAATNGQEDLNVASLIDKDALSLVDAARQRLKLWDISDSQIRKIEESEKPIRTLTVYSPFSGYVLQKNVNQGQRIMPGEKLFDIADLSSVWITADIYEFELPIVKVGDSATVQLAYFPGKQFATRIDFIYPVLEGETRTVKARFSIPNQGGLLKPQMFTNVELKISLGRRLAVPSDAVINTGVRRIAYVDKGDGNFEPREVMTGVETDRLVEITAGLKAGDKVAFSANFLIDSEAKLKGVEPLPMKATAKTAGGTPHRQ